MRNRRIPSDQSSAAMPRVWVDSHESSYFIDYGFRLDKYPQARVCRSAIASKSNVNVSLTIYDSAEPSLVKGIKFQGNTQSVSINWPNYATRPIVVLERRSPSAQFYLLTLNLTGGGQCEKTWADENLPCMLPLLLKTFRIVKARHFFEGSSSLGPISLIRETDLREVTCAFHPSSLP
jgi:hypothetical protein